VDILREAGRGIRDHKGKGTRRTMTFTDTTLSAPRIQNKPDGVVRVLSGEDENTSSV